MKDITIHTDKINYIKLPQLLKLAGIISQGSDAKALIQDKLIKVNDKEIEELRKKIYIGDIVEIKGMEKLNVCGDL